MFSDVGFYLYLTTTIYLQPTAAFRPRDSEDSEEP